MNSIDIARQKLQQRVSIASAQKAEQKVGHTHNWKLVRERLQVAERTVQQSNKGMDYKGGPAYFITKLCKDAGCSERRRLAYKVER